MVNNVVRLDTGIECVHSKSGRVHCTLYGNGSNCNTLDSISDVYRPINNNNLKR